MYLLSSKAVLDGRVFFGGGGGGLDGLNMRRGYAGTRGIRAAWLGPSIIAGSLGATEGRELLLSGAAAVAAIAVVVVVARGSHCRRLLFGRVLVRLREAALATGARGTLGHAGDEDPDAVAVELVEEVRGAPEPLDAPLAREVQLVRQLAPAEEEELGLA